MSEMDRKNLLRNRNARAKQRQYHVSSKRRDRQTFDNLGLTKRNADYMFRFNKAFRGVKLNHARKQTIINQMVSELQQNQKKGMTARNQYGTIQHRIHMILHPPKKSVPMNHNYWPNAIYNMLIFFILFNILYGITYLISKQAQNERGAAGFVGLVITSIVAGLGMPVITRLFDDRIQHTHNGLVRGLVMIAMFLIWMAVFYLTALLPRAINPIFNPGVNLIIAVIGIAAAFWVHKNYNVTSAFTRPKRV